MNIKSGKKKSHLNQLNKTLRIVKNGENGFLVKPRDPIDIAEKVVMISKDSNLIEEMILKQRETLKKYVP